MPGTMHTYPLHFRGFVLLLAGLLAVAGSHVDAAGLPEARQHLLRGRYAEAADAYRQLASEHPAEAALGLARALASQGKIDAALETLAAASEAFPVEAEPPEEAGGANVAKTQGPLPVDLLADLQAEVALLQFQRGAYDLADRAVAAALAREPDHVLARWVQAERFRVRGQLKEAEAACEWFVTFYNREQLRIQRADDLRYIALAATQAARWQRRSGDFRFVVNRLLPKALELEPDYWPAHYEVGRLFIEKYNPAQASRSLAAALQINAQAADVHAALAEEALQNYDLDVAKRSLDRAIEIQPRHALAHALQADWRLANFDHAAALASLNIAVECNPASEQVLGRLAALKLMAAGGDQQPGKPGDIRPKGVPLSTPEAIQAATAEQLLAWVAGQNPAAGEFYFTLAQRLDEARRFDLAERYYALAAERMPQLPGPQAAMGLMLMRLGREAEARKALEAAFAADPFHVRVANMLQVLDVLETYTTLETEHFIFRHDPRDALLARSAARYMEDEVYPQLCRQFGFEPTGKTLIEFFNQAKNTPGHGWFSARMLGLPYLGTVGACAGRMVAMVSPAAMPQKFNWARVLKHEFVHILNLQQTAFNVPHWFTEALAVMNEGDPRPEAWNRLLLERHRAGTLFDLDDINLGFIRPQSSDDWTLAYCQAEIYAEYMLERFGEDAIARLLEGFSDQPDTPTAIRRAFNIGAADFQQGYEAYLKRLVGQIKVAPSTSGKLSYAELVKAAASEPANVELLGELAFAELTRKQYAAARQAAEAALAAAVPPADGRAAEEGALARYVLARLKLLVGEEDAALKILEQAHDKRSPHAETLLLLAQLKGKQGDAAFAEECYVLGQRTWPQEARWSKLLAETYLAARDEVKLVEPLEHLAGLDVDDAAARKKLAQLALKRRDFQQAAQWAEQVLHIDVADAEMQRFLAVALTLLGRHAAATEAYAAAVELKPTELLWRVEWAEALRRAGRAEQAVAELQAVLKLDPRHEKAVNLLQSWSASP